MYYIKEYLKRAHREIDTIFRVLFPEHGMAVREEQIMLCHEMLDNLLGRNIALCDAGVGIGKTYAYLVACVLMRKYSLLAEGCSPYEQRPVVISTSSITLQKAMLMYGKEANNQKQEIDRQHHTIPNQRPKDKHYGNVHSQLYTFPRMPTMALL